MTLYLSIRRIYLDQIASGVKKYEYRADTPYWRDRLKKPYKEIIFHQYKGSLLRAEYLSVKLIPTPLDLLEFIGTKKCFAIKLGKVYPTNSKV